MIIAIGVDAVDIQRFAQWYTKPLSSLRRIFSDEEIQYCLSSIQKSSERFALRFAIREAIYKIIATNQCTSIPFLSLCKATTVRKHEHNVPYIIFNWNVLNKYKLNWCTQVIWHLSCTHTSTTAIAYVIAEKQ